MIGKVINKYKLHEQPNDFSFWQSKSYEERLNALEQIRKEYNQWRYDAEPGFQINFIDIENLKKNKRATGRPQDLADAESLE